MILPRLLPVWIAWVVAIGSSYAFAADAPPAATGQTPDSSALSLPEPQPLVPGARVLTLWPKGSPMLKALAGYDKPEKWNLGKGSPPRVNSVENIHNPSIEVHLAPADKANGTAIVVIAGGGNKTCNVGGEGIDIAEWLNGLGISAFIERYRLRPYDSTVDALADTQRSIRLVRAHAKEWNIDPKRVGTMGFSAGGEQSAWVELKFDEGNPRAADPVERESCRPDFSVLVYAGWLRMDMSHVPKDAPPAFLTSAGVDDAFHARQTVEFYSALFEAKIPVELHIYGHGGHGGGISPRKGIPFGTWPAAFVAWAKDLKLLGSNSVTSDAQRIQGTWKVVKKIKNGQAEDVTQDSSTLTFSGDTVTALLGNEQQSKGNFTIDDSKSPRWITLTGASGPHAGQTFAAIYQFDGDTFKLAYSTGKNCEIRPTDFEAKDGQAIEVLERAKANP